MIWLRPEFGCFVAVSAKDNASSRGIGSCRWKTCEEFHIGHWDSDRNHHGPCYRKGESWSSCALMSPVSRLAGFSVVGQWLQKGMGYVFLVFLERFATNSSRFEGLLLPSQCSNISLSDHSLLFKRGYLDLSHCKTNCACRLALVNAATSCACAVGCTSALGKKNLGRLVVLAFYSTASCSWSKPEITLSTLMFSFMFSVIGVL